MYVCKFYLKKCSLDTNKLVLPIYCCVRNIYLIILEIRNMPQFQKNLILLYLIFLFFI